MRLELFVVVLCACSAGGSDAPGPGPGPGPGPTPTSSPSTAAAAAAIDAGPVRRPPVDAGAAAALVLSYGGGNRFGSDSLTIDAKGDARFEYSDGRGEVTRGGPVRLDAAELRALEKLLARHQVCSLASPPSYLPVPEETRTALVLQLGSLRCSVSLYANEWRDRPDAAPIEKALSELSLRVQRARAP